MPSSTLGSLLMTDGQLPGNTAGVNANTGVPGINTLRIGSNAVEGETVTIGADVYEIDTDAVVGQGRVRVAVSALTPLIVANALAAAINNNASSGVSAHVGSSPVRVVVAPRKTSAFLLTTFTFAETLSGANNAWDGAVFHDGKPAGPRLMAAFDRPVSSAESTATVVDVVLPFVTTPSLIQVEVTGSNTAHKPWDGQVVIDPLFPRLILITKGSAGNQWTTGDVLRVTAWGPPLS